MTNLGILIKNNINCFIGTLQGKKNRKSTTAAASMIVLGAIGIIALYSFQAWSMFTGLGAMGLDMLCVFHAIITSITCLIILSVLRTTSKAKSNDTDLLLSLPLKKSEIVVSKALNKYLFDLFFSFMLLMPFIVIYQIRVGFNTSVTLLGILTVILLPLMSTGISYICDFIVTRIFNKSKSSSFLKSMFSILIFVVVFALMMVKTFGYGSVTASSMEAYFSDRPISNLILKFIFFGDIGGLFALLAITLIPFVIGCTLYYINIGKTFVGFKPKKKELIFNNGNASFGSLFKKEISNYMTTPIYVTNTILSPVMILALGILLPTVGMQGISALFGAAISPTLLVGFITIMFCFLCAMATISACSISLEGKQLWIIKSLPININKLFMAKILLNIIMLAPFLFVASSIIGIFMNISFIEYLIILIIPILCSCIISFGGLYINLWLPKLEWTDEAQVVKQGFAVLVTMLLGMAVSLIPVGLYFLFETLSIEIIALITGGIYLLILTLFVLLDFTHGKKMFEKL